MKKGDFRFEGFIRRLSTTVEVMRETDAPQSIKAVKRRDRMKHSTSTRMKGRKLMRRGGMEVQQIKQKGEGEMRFGRRRPVFGRF